MSLHTRRVRLSGPGTGAASFTRPTTLYSYSYSFCQYVRRGTESQRVRIRLTHTYSHSYSADRGTSLMLNIDRSYLSRHLVLFSKCSPMVDVTLGCSSSLVDVFGFVSQAGICCPIRVLSRCIVFPTFRL